MATWRYGDAGDRWQVETGDVWHVGPHVIACVDLESDRARAFYASITEPVACMYTDPPWSTGNAKSFRTKAGVESEGTTVERLWSIIMSIAARHVTGDVYAEIGVKHRADAVQWMQAAGRRVTDQWSITYYRKYPCCLLCSAKRVLRMEDAPDDRDDSATPGWAIERSTDPGEIVMDPCAGQGGTPVHAHRLGRRFIGSELHPRRMAVTIDKLVKLGCTAERVARL